jgi:hypothetical protein
MSRSEQKQPNRTAFALEGWHEIPGLDGQWRPYEVGAGWMGEPLTWTQHLEHRAGPGEDSVDVVVMTPAEIEKVNRFFGVVKIGGDGVLSRPFTAHDFPGR